MNESFVQKENGFFHLEQWEAAEPGLVAGFTPSKKGAGVFDALNLAFHVNDRPEAVRENRRSVAEQIAFPLSGWVGCEQTHGTHIEKVSRQDAGRGAADYASAFRATDGLYTTECGVLLTLCYADCVPLFFLDRTAKKAGTAHAGWKGAVEGIGVQMVTKWIKEGSLPENIQAAIGPSICGRCYKVGEKVAEAAGKWYEPGEPLPFSPLETEKAAFLLSLQTFNKDLLVKAGIPEKNITVTGYCSSCSPGFFSHRRDNGETGRMIGYIGWRG